MSNVRRLAAGLPAAGITVFATLALASPATASPDVSDQGGKPAVVASPGDRGGDGGYPTVDDTTAPPPASTPVTTPPTTPPATVPSESPVAVLPTGGTRGHSGYELNETVSPTPTGTGGTKAVPPAGVQDERVPPVKTTTKGGTLAVTGAPLAGTLALGGLLVGGGAAALWYTRRRKTA
ncbi:hypothetical protein [Actinoplanes sp. NPDC051851]|uniref:hypothetical protein n=1 Tax=Actinoplanes sp. NPDC051851 TaxID=3154753 RepID=UPI00341AFDF2